MGGKPKNCFRNFFNGLLLNTGHEWPITPANKVAEYLGFTAEKLAELLAK